MARKVTHESEFRQVHRNGVLYEFHRDVDRLPAGGVRVEFLARRWNGYHWIVLHRFTV
jgi:hypothetical protein